MGVGKTAVSQELKKQLPNAVFLDGDWCWDADPFQVTRETKNMVLENICFLLNQFIRCSAYENVIFCWVMHEQSIIDAVTAKLDIANCTVKNISLICGEETLKEHLQRDVDAGIRKADIIGRSVARIPLYRNLNTAKITVDNKTVSQIAEEIRT